MTFEDRDVLDSLSDRSPQGIAGAFARAIRTGDLAAGERLPTVRSVAERLGVSPATVSSAWQALQRTGAVTTRGRAGTFVAEQPTSDWLSRRVRDMRGETSALRVDLSRGTPDPSLLPDLAASLTRVAARASTDAYHELPVLPELRALLAEQWPYPVEALTVVDGATDGIARALEQSVSFGDRVVVESPGFGPIFDLVEELGGQVVPVTLDASGIVPRSLAAALRSGPTAVVLQPRAHNPTGVSMTPRRCADLARVLGKHREHSPVVIEDDHSGPISSRPAVSLGTHLPERVLHVRSFSKSHGPDLRIAALGGPSALLDPIVSRRMLGPGWTSRMLQTILLDLLTRSSSMDEVEEARRQYFGRQRRFVERLGELGLEIAEPDGINLWVPVRDERAALLHLAAADIRAAAGSPFHAEDDHAPHIRLTTGLVRPEDVDAVASALVEATRVGERPAP